MTIRRVYKYPLEITDHQLLRLPADHKILLVADQDGQACLWADVDPDSRPVTLDVLVFGTGHPIPAEPRLTHLGTFLQGQFVWHVYAVPACVTGQ